MAITGINTQSRRKGIRMTAPPERKARLTDEPRRQFCAYCGKDMGLWTRFSDRDDTCGDPECDRYARDSERERRERAHEELDRANGWDQW